MMKNVGGYDRIARLIVGLVLLAWGLAALGGYLTFGLAGDTLLAVVALALVVGAAVLVTGWTQQDPVNRALGRNTYHGGDGSVDEPVMDETTVEEPTGEKPRTG